MNPRDQSKSQDSEEDDLALFKQEKRLKLLKDNQILKQSHLDSDFSQQNSNKHTEFNKFYGNQTEVIKKEINKKQQPSVIQINQEELSVKRLRAFNATKYFEKIKLTLLKEIIIKTKQLVQITNQFDSHHKQTQESFCLFLSIIPEQTLRKFKQIKSKNPFTIKDKEIFQILQTVLTHQFLNCYNNLLSAMNKKTSKTQLLFQLSSFLNFKIQKIGFFNIQNFVDESFYNLNFDKNQRRNKKSKKNATKLQQQIKNKIQRHLYEQQAQEKEEFVDLNNFSFDTISKNMSKSEDQIKNEKRTAKIKSEKIQQIKKFFAQQTYQLYSFEENRWKLFLSVENHFEQIELNWFKQNILNGLPIIAFYSLQSIKPQIHYQQLVKLRKMDSIVMRDCSMYFGDDWKKLAARAKRVGVRPLLIKMFRFFNFLKPFDILQPYETFLQQKTLQERKQILINTELPKTKNDFNLSAYFLTPSRIGKYHILSSEAQPIQKDLQQDQEKIYWKDDLVPVCSRMGWIDFSRMVRISEQALKKTQNRNKKQIQLYRYEQTQPYQLPMDEQGNFILDPQHNSIYVPPDLKLPEQTVIVKEKVSYICNKHKFRFAKIVQGFIHNGGMRVLPNQIGSIIYKKDKEQILRLYEQRQEILNRKKQDRQDEKIQKMWRDILKYVKLLQRMGPQS